MEQKLINYVERHLGYARDWKGDAKAIVTFETKAFAAVEFFCEAVYEENPELEKKISDRWDNEWRKEFFELSIS